MIIEATDTRAPGAHRSLEQRLMWITRQRVFYAGLLGDAAQRVLGGHGVYLSPAGLPLEVCFDDAGGWQSGTLIVVPPGVPHRVRTRETLILHLLVEPESVDPAHLPEVLRRHGPVEAPAFAQAVRAAHARLLAAMGRGSFDDFDFDQLFFGAPLVPRALDARVREVVERIAADPAATLPAKIYAASVGLSFSRFLHLFKAETGTTFRAFRAWKRARSLLRQVRQTASMTEIALDAGYPDSTHFSHSIRQVYGLRPSDIFAGSRRLALYC